MQIPSYSQVYALGHKYLTELLEDEVVVQEKIDGSQFSFTFNGRELSARSKGATIEPTHPPSLFKGAVETALKLANENKLPPDFIYRGEALQKPKHNTLKYSRVPVGNVILYDVDIGIEDYLPNQDLEKEAVRLGLEAVPTLFVGKLTSVDMLKEMLDIESCLGGTKIEGVVIKNYHRFGLDKKALMGKFVSEAFKETHSSDWKLRNPVGRDVIHSIIDNLRVEARWEKAVQHLKEAENLTYSPQDIGPLLKEVVTDILKEEGESIKDILFKHFWKDISRGVVKGVPEWYKEKLAGEQFRQYGIERK